MTPQNTPFTRATTAQKRKLNRRIESVGWALFLIWSGTLLIAPDELAPEGSWLIGTGLIIVASMGIRYLYGIRIDGFWTVLGLLALCYGLSDNLGFNLPVLPVVFIIVGVVILYNAFFRKIYHRNVFWRGCRHRNEFWRGCWKGENDEKA